MFMTRVLSLLDLSPHLIYQSRSRDFIGCDSHCLSFLASSFDISSLYFDNCLFLVFLYVALLFCSSSSLWLSAHFSTLLSNLLI